MVLVSIRWVLRQLNEKRGSYCKAVISKMYQIRLYNMLQEHKKMLHVKGARHQLYMSNNEAWGALLNLGEQLNVSCGSGGVFSSRRKDTLLE